MSQKSAPAAVPAAARKAAGVRRKRAGEDEHLLPYIYALFKKVLEARGTSLEILQKTRVALTHAMQDAIAGLARAVFDFMRYARRVRVSLHDVKGGAVAYMGAPFKDHVLAAIDTAVRLYHDSFEKEGERKLHHERAGLVFPILRVRREFTLTQPLPSGMADDAQIAFAAAAEYLCYEIINDAVECALQRPKAKRLAPADLAAAINGNDDYRQMFPIVIIPGSGSGHRSFRAVVKKDDAAK